MLVQSISDIITNSSSEVFVMNENNAKYYDKLEDTNDCISISLINMDWVRYNYDEWEMICKVCNLDINELSSYYRSLYTDQETWDVFIDLHKKEIEEKLIGLYWVDIEDHFPDSYDVCDSARSDSLWTDYRH